LIPLPTPGRALTSYLLILALIFSGSFLGGILAPDPVRKEATEAFQFVAGNYTALSGGMLFFILLLHNLVASILILVSGVLLGIVPILSMASNGFFLGALYRQAVEAAGFPKAMLKVLPHGITEIPALLFAAAYGLWLGVTLVRRMRGTEGTLLRFHIEHSFRRYFAVVFPLLIVSAAIETALILWAQHGRPSGG